MKKHFTFEALAILVLNSSAYGLPDFLLDKEATIQQQESGSMNIICIIKSNECLKNVTKTNPLSDFENISF